MIAVVAGGSRGRRGISTGRPRRRGPSIDHLGRPVRAGLGVGPAVRPGADLERWVDRFWDVRDTRPPEWQRTSFRRWVEVVRTQLGPISGTAGLTESFAREAALLRAFDDVDDAARRRLERSPLVVAYVLRWLELRDGVDLPAWRDLVTGPVAERQPPARSDGPAGGVRCRIGVDARDLSSTVGTVDGVQTTERPAPRRGAGRPSFRADQGLGWRCQE